MPTPKTKRVAPTKRLNDYVINRLDASESSLSSIPFNAFHQISGMEYDEASPAAYWQTISSTISLGFSITLDDVTYSTFQVSPCGWMVLNDASIGTTTLSALGLSTGYDLQNLSISGGRHLVLSPWASRLRCFRSTYNASNNLATRIKYGYEPPPTHIAYNQRRYGVVYANDNHTTLGRRCVIRWYAVTDPDASRDMRLATIECVVFENGRIEFRYGPRSDALSIYDDVMSGSANTAVVGIFASGTVAQPQFRDLSRELNYATTRQPYPLGGTIYTGSYSDGGTSYGRSLTYAANWFGGAFIAQPPMNRRRMLRNYTSQISDMSFHQGTTPLVSHETYSMFRDGNSPTYTTQSVDIAAGMSRLFANGSQDALNRANLFGTSNNITASVVVSRRASDDLLVQAPIRQIAGFNDETSTNPSATFALSGSSFELYEGLLTGELRQKKRIDLEFEINNRTHFFPLTSSIYYLDPNVGMWRMPPRSVTLLTSTSSIGDSDLESPLSTYPSYFTSYDGRGWDSTGHFFASASFVFKYANTENNGGSTKSFSYQNMDLIASGSGDSVTMASIYAGNECTFELPIQSDFLLEKMILDVPIEAGPGWFSDLTMTGNKNEANGTLVDQGGPGLTFVLMHEQKSGETNIARRAIIMSGTLTHELDMVRRATTITNSDFGDYVAIRMEGFLQDSQPTTYVPVTSSSTFFTGSIRLECEAAVSAGLVATLRKARFATTSSTNLINDFLSSSTLKPDFIVRYNTFGRAKNGLNADITSPFGKEFAGVGTQFVNQFSHLNGTDVSQIEAHIAVSGSSMFYIATSLFTSEKNYQSPYLLKPGSRLILAVSKTRPWGVEDANPSSSRVSPHDIKMSVGTVKASFFGTQLVNERERLTSLDQTLKTNALYTVVGNEPIIDQFIGSYRQLYVGTMRDDYVTGTMVYRERNNTTNTLLTGSRGRLFSKQNVRNYQPSTSLNIYSSSLGSDGVSKRYVLVTGSVDNTTTYSDVIRPSYAKANNVMLNVAASDNERYFDTLPPVFSEATKINGGKVVTRETFDENDPYEANIVFDTVFFGKSSVTGDSTECYVDKDWLRTFPFEPRYANVPRTRTYVDSVTAEYNLSSTVSGTVLVKIPSTSLDKVSVYYGSVHQNGATLFLNKANDRIGYTHLSGTIYRGVKSQDLLKILFGFGDQNTVYDIATAGLTGLVDDNIRDYGGRYHGMHNSVNYHALLAISSISYYAISPFIRGWRYGLMSAFPEFTRTYWNTKHYGQPRDMLEQRLDAKTYDQTTNNVNVSPISIKFLDSQGRVTLPENTLSQNLSYEATSSAPFTDAIAVERSPINTNIVNKGVVTLKADAFGNVAF